MRLIPEVLAEICIWYVLIPEVLTEICIWYGLISEVSRDTSPDVASVQHSSGVAIGYDELKESTKRGPVTKP